VTIPRPIIFIAKGFSMRIATLLLATSATLAAAPALAQTAPPPPAETMPDDAAADGDIIVFGRGETRNVQTINDAAIELLAPGTSPLKAIERLPGVNFQSADPFGAYEWSQRVSIRSFNQNQLGFTFDGIPLGDGSYGNNNGLHVSRAVISENVGSVRVSQGSGSIGTQATNNLGGTIETFSRDPEGRFGVAGTLTYGSENTIRAFSRVEFGTTDGPRGYISALFANADKWKGEGEQQQRQVNARLIVPIGGADLDVWYSFSRRNEQDYQDLSLEMINRLGYDWDNFGISQYALAVRVADIAANRGETGATPFNPAAGTVYPAPITNVDDAYLDASGIRRDHLAAIGLTAPVGDEGRFLIRGYYHSNLGQGLWGTPYVPSPNGVPISIRTTEYDIDRQGVFASLTVPIATTEVSVGGWYENNHFSQARRFYALTSRDVIGRSFQGFQTSPFFTQWEFDFVTETLQYYVQNRIDLGDLTINLGWKGFRVTNDATPVVAGGRASGRIEVEDWFQPHAGFAYAFNDNVELFGGFTQVTRAFVSSSTSGPFATTQAGFDAIRSTLRPEESDTYEAGLRFNSSTVNGVIAGYYVDFRNRLLGLATGAGIVGNPAILQNVGSVRALGFEAAVDVRLGGGLGVYAAYAYNDATYRDNVLNAAGAIVAATADKTVVDSPRHILRGEINYDMDGFFARVGANYMSRRFFNYENDRSVGDRVLVDASIGYRFTDRIEVQLSATNLFDEDYVSTIGSNGFGNRGDNQTLLAGAPQQFFGTLKIGF
jgi:iron complex outermembrane recepter protein